MDTWLSTLLATAPKKTLNDVRTHAQVVAAKAAAAFDLCFLTGDPNFTTPVTDMAQCDADPRLQKHASPRQVAGGSLEENILACQLEPIHPFDYAPVTFMAAQWTRLNAAFPAGGACRLEQAWRRPAGSDLAAHLRGLVPGRRDAPAGTYGAEPAACRSVAEPGTRPSLRPRLRVPKEPAIPSPRTP